MCSSDLQRACDVWERAWESGESERLPEYVRKVFERGSLCSVTPRDAIRHASFMRLQGASQDSAQDAPLWERLSRKKRRSFTRRVFDSIWGAGAEEKAPAPLPFIFVAGSDGVQAFARAMQDEWHLHHKPPARTGNGRGGLAILLSIFGVGDRDEEFRGEEAAPPGIYTLEDELGAALEELAARGVDMPRALRECPRAPGGQEAPAHCDPSSVMLEALRPLLDAAVCSRAYSVVVNDFSSVGTALVRGEAEVAFPRLDNARVKAQDASVGGWRLDRLSGTTWSWTKEISFHHS